jgi:DNA-binding transcriptional ArsR family regulator
LGSVERCFVLRWRHVAAVPVQSVLVEPVDPGPVLCESSSASGLSSLTISAFDLKMSACAKMRIEELTEGGVVATPLYQAKAEFFRTLGHPARIRVLELLSERDHAVHELLGSIAIEPSNLSQQLAVLRRAGLISQHRSGGEVVYSVSVPQVRDLLLAARQILLEVLADQETLKAELSPAGRRRR